MSNRKKIAIILIITVLLLVVFLSATSAPNLLVSQVYEVPSTFSTAVPYDTNTMVLSNGRAFITYNYDSGQTKLLSPDNINPVLAGIDSLSVSSNKQFLLFHLSQANPDSPLYSQLQSIGDNPSQAYWWVYNIANKAFLPLPANSIIAKMRGNYVYVLGQINRQEMITTYSLNGLHQQDSFNIVSSINFLPLNNKVLLQTINDHILLTQNGTVNQTLYSSTTLSAFWLSSNTVIGITNSGSKQELVKLNTTKSNENIIGDTNGQLAWSGSAYVLFANNNTVPLLSTYDSLNDKVTTWKFSSNYAKSLGSKILTPVSILGPNIAVVSDNNSRYFLIGAGFRDYSRIPVNYTKTLTVNNQPVTIGNSVSSNDLEVSVSGGNTANIQAAVYAQLHKDGYDPNLIPIDYIFTIPHVFN